MLCNFSRICGLKLLWFWACLVGFADGKRYSWCQTYNESCVGKLHEFQESKVPSVSGEGQTMRFVDWDGDGDTDVLSGDYNKSGTFVVTWHERLSDSTFHLHELLKLGAEEGTESSLEVVDWDGDGKLDLLVCALLDGHLTVSFVNRSFLPWHGQGPSVVHGTILSVNGSRCETQAADFDEDGDKDLVIGDRYFERISAEVFERRGDENPLAIFDDDVLWIADVDGDGRLEVLVKGWVEQSQELAQIGLRYFRRTADGSFVEPPENPFAPFGTYSGEWYSWRLFVADLDADGLPDFLAVELYHPDPWVFEPITPSVRDQHYKWRLLKFYKHVLNKDMVYSSHINPYEVIDLQHQPEPTVVDWNGDGYADVVMSGVRRPIQMRLFEFQDGNFHEVAGVFDNITVTLNSWYRLAIMDWDRDGDLDVMVSSRHDGKIHYFETNDGVLQDEKTDHPFTSIRLERGPHYIQPVAVDWDNDGDMDLVLGPPDGRLFEQLSDGSLREWPLDQSPFKTVLAIQAENDPDLSWRFVDCDSDGDFDLLRLQFRKYPPIQACEHDGTTLRCDHDYLCLGTNLSNWRREGGPLEEAFGSGQMYFDLGNLSDGLELIMSNDFKKTVALWKAGFCVPKDPCHEKGFCLARHLNCSCIAPGHELGDCSGCEPHFHSVPGGKAGQLHGCRACPGNGHPCYGRGTCFDDEAAKTRQESTALLIARGNGSCSCNDDHFYGSDEEGRSTCAEGSCPAGTEEKDGHCDPCDAGSFSLEGGKCKPCLPGNFSLPGSSNCSPCRPGSIAPEEASARCSPCPSGQISAAGSTACSECDAGLYASNGACMQCPAGKFSTNASVRCSPCPSGQISAAGSAACSQCDAGRFSNEGLTCEGCPGGHYSFAGSSVCESCPVNHVSGPNSAACRSCENHLVRASPDGMKQRCQIVGMDVVLAVISWMTSACFTFLCLIGLCGRIPIADVSEQGQKHVVTSRFPHFVLMWKWA